MHRVGRRAMVLSRYLPWAAASWILVAHSVCLAQTRLELALEAKLRNESRCRGSSQSFARAVRDEESRRGLGLVASCPDTGAAILAREWSLQSRDAGYVRELAFASKRLIDRRLANAAFGAASDRSLPWDSRFAALDALATQLAPTLDHRTGTQFVRVPVRRIEPPHDIVSSAAPASRRREHPHTHRQC
jgi:hypothetical protein